MVMMWMEALLPQRGITARDMMVMMLIEALLPQRGVMAWDVMKGLMIETFTPYGKTSVYDDDSPTQGLALSRRPAPGLVPQCRSALRLTIPSCPAPGLVPPCSSGPLPHICMIVLNLTMRSLLPVCDACASSAKGQRLQPKITPLPPVCANQDAPASAEAAASGDDLPNRLASNKIGDPSNE